MMKKINVPAASGRNHYFQFGLGLDQEVETEIIEIASSKTANQVSKPELGDDQKRWLIVGICLNSVLAPALRRFVCPCITKEYNKLRASKKIDKQTPNNFKRSFNSYDLNYESINNNVYSGGRYDFRVKNAVDFSKLFLQTHMANYSAFDDSCDLSALLAFLINVSSIFPNCRPVANQIRKVRNKWAHCNFAEWDDIAFMKTFQFMYQLLTHLQLQRSDEIAELTKWQKYGLHFLQGTSIDLNILRIIKEETKHLALFSKELATKTQAGFDEVQGAVEAMYTEMTQKIDLIDQKQKSQDEAFENLQSSVGDLHNRTLHTGDRLDTLENQVTENKVNLLELKEKVLGKPANKPFFYPPNKIDVFVGRKWELQKLSSCIGPYDNHVDVICGLGGCGKTTLLIEFAWQYQDLYPAGTFWMSADSDESLNNSILRLAIDVGIVGSQFKDTFYKVLKWMTSIEQKWLLVIDNLDSEDISRTAKEIITGTWRRNSHGHIAVTTRRERQDIEEELQVKEDHCLVVDVLSKDQSIEFLQKRSGRTNFSYEEGLDELATELAGLPLALEQAAAHIKNLNCTFQQYVTKFTAKRLKLLRNAKSAFETDKMRLAVRTTWQLNFDFISHQSEEEGLGDAAYTIMKIASFLHSDAIPVEVFNSGQPDVDDEDLKERVGDTIEVKQIISILTRFSLFQMTDAKVLSVHRLVQEVVRDSIRDKLELRFILESSVRMINKALQSTTKPYEIVNNDIDKDKRRGLLLLWSLVAANASSLKIHVENFIRANSDFHKLILNIESVSLFQTSAIYHSVNQRQDQALADQEQMIYVMSSIDIPEDHCRLLTSVKIPLLAKDRSVFQECIASTIDNEVGDDETGTHLDIETLRTKGNEAFNSKVYTNAIHCYSEAIRVSPTDSVDWRLLSNRSLAYLKMHDYTKALDDANNCIAMNPSNWKAFCWKAYAIAGLIKERDFHCSWKSIGMAAASVAAKLQPDVLLEYKMKINYPLVLFNVLEETDDLKEKIQSLLNRPFTSLLLKKGSYELDECVTTRSVQVIGIEKDVTIRIKNLAITRLPDASFKIKIEKDLSVHFENVSFEGTNSVYVGSCHALATFVQCRFSTGRKGCDKFPNCDFGEGCCSPEDCKKHIQTDSFEPETGIAGSPGIICDNEGKAYLYNCVLDRCGGGGVLVTGDGSFLCIKNSTVKRMRQSGVEARDGGNIHAIDNFIVNNQAHGVLLGPRGNGFISGNFIVDNDREGILGCGTISNKVSTESPVDPGSGSSGTISDNRIAQNGLSGISLDGGVYQISRNSIFENWCWGMMIKSRSSAQVLNNNFYENKSGGIRIGYNYSASVYIDGNTIHDHNGPPLYLLPEPTSATRLFYLGNKEDETHQYTRPPIISNRNIARNNDRKIQHFNKTTSALQSCNFCHSLWKDLKSCGKCKKAQYCSKDCQANHWKCHKNLCKVLKDRYSVEVDMNDTRPVMPTDAQTLAFRHFDASLSGVGQGAQPDRRSSKRFVVKIQGNNYTPYNPRSEMILYDQSLSVDVMFHNATIYNFLVECGCLSTDMFATKTLFMWASFKDKGRTLCLHMASLPEFQPW